MDPSRDRANCGSCATLVSAPALKLRLNRGTSVVPGLPPAPNAFNGQFVQIDVTGVRVTP